VVSGQLGLHEELRVTHKGYNTAASLQAKTSPTASSLSEQRQMMLWGRAPSASRAQPELYRSSS